MDEKRKAPRRRVLKEGKIVFADGQRVLDCTIRDFSDAGARLLIANTVGLPDTFHLYEKSSGMLYPADCPMIPTSAPKAARRFRARGGQ